MTTVRCTECERDVPPEPGSLMCEALYHCAHVSLQPMTVPCESGRANLTSTARRALASLEHWTDALDLPGPALSEEGLDTIGALERAYGLATYEAHP